MSPDSRRRVKVTVNGNPYLVEVSDLAASPISITVNGRPYMVDIETTEVELTSADEPAVASEIVARQMVAPEEAPTSTDPAGSGVSVVTAPMPGNILDIAVKPGDAVRYRQQLCSLEAMKMNNAIRSPRDGVVARVQVIEGQAVAHGDVLFTFE